MVEAQEGKRLKTGDGQGAAAMEVDNPKTPNTQQHSGFSTEMLKVYYSRIFPHKQWASWFSYGHDAKGIVPEKAHAYLSRREISFTLENDVYIRYQSFKDEEEFRRALMDKCPHKIDVGPVYTVDPQKRAAYSGGAEGRIFAPQEREVVFDIDMTDYGDLYPDVQQYDEESCRRHWVLMNAAVKVVNDVLREDFGFQHILWVFSGRRGVHAWVCDEKARKLTDEQRTSVVEFFNIFKGAKTNEQGVRKALLTSPLHPSYERAFRILERYWVEQVLPEFGLLETPEHLRKVLSMIPDPETRDKVQDRLRRIRSDDAAAEKWEALKDVVKKAAKGKQGKMAYELARTPNEILFSYTFPRLDLEVTKHMNHLLKAPFCVHPKTGKVCVAIDPDDCDNFDIGKSPTLAGLLNEMNEVAAKGQNIEDSPQWRPSLDIFQRTFLDGLVKDSRQIALSKSSRPSLGW